jgi:hypothetical protein
MFRNAVGSYVILFCEQHGRYRSHFRSVRYCHGEKSSQNVLRPSYIWVMIADQIPRVVLSSCHHTITSPFFTTFLGVLGGCSQRPPWVAVLNDHLVWLSPEWVTPRDCLSYIRWSCCTENRMRHRYGSQGDDSNRHDRVLLTCRTS